MSEYDTNSRVDEILRKIRQERGEISSDPKDRISSIRTSWTSRLPRRARRAFRTE